MQRERILETSNNDDELDTLLPEIAKLLNVSVSSLERYPSDLRKLLCQVYIDSYDSDDGRKLSALSQVISLNIENTDNPFSSNTANKGKSNQQKQKQESKDSDERKYILTRKTIMDNARIIASEAQHQQQQEQSRDINGKNN